MKGFDFWETEITYLKKVGPKRATALQAEASIRTYGDLLWYFPRKYIDKSRLTSIREVRPDSPLVILSGRLGAFELIQHGGKGGRLTTTLSDGSGTVRLNWFQGIRWIQQTYREGQEVIISGKPQLFNQLLTIVHPEVDPVRDEETPHVLKIVPQYPSTDKLRQQNLDARGFRALLFQLLETGRHEIQESLPELLRKKYRLIGLRKAFEQIHFPDSFEALRQARERLKFEEMLLFQLMVGERRLIAQPKIAAPAFSVVGELFNTFYHKHIPFELTQAQKRVIREIRIDLAKTQQMNRLVQGDVGSGKTMVAFMCMLIALDNGFQAAMMAPTEILARQHFNTLSRFAAPLNIEVALITGSTRTAERRLIQERLAAGNIRIMIGTHALLEDPVQFQNLGLTVIDEQHKFGVEQRARLWKKGKVYPHNMVMTATPIPRTLALTLYGDIQTSIIDELPPGRTQVFTRVFNKGERLRLLGLVREQLKAGRQAYFVYPLIEENEKLNLLAAQESYQQLMDYFRDIYVGMVHGRMPAAEKEKAMIKFKSGEMKILVSTTVIEVGVDVPNATVMVIENAERFGLSQLHQLRGRVGRGSAQSFCYLMTGTQVSAESMKRLQAMEASHDGFRIAEIDLQLRGPGDFLGTRQSGMPEFRLINLQEDLNLIQHTREAAESLLNQDPGLNRPEHYQIKQQLLNYIRQNGRYAGIA